MKLRTYQRSAMRKSAGKNNVLFVAPTGAGKGTMAAYMLAKAAKSGQRAVFIVHLRDIAEDIAKRVRAMGVRVGMVVGGHGRDDDAPVQVASVQSLAGMALRGVDLLIADEAHHYRADEWQAVLESTRAKRLVGFTATPQRADGKGLGEVFGHLVVVARYSDMLALNKSDPEQGIVPVTTLIPERKLDGEIAMCPVDAYMKHGDGRCAFVFARNVMRGKEVCRKLRRRGVAAEFVDALTDKDERSAILERLRRGQTKVVVNVGTMTEGVDVPRVSCVIIEQMFTHHGSYLQRTGRCMRAMRGKRDALLIDLAGSSIRHGEPQLDREFALDSDPIRLADDEDGWVTIGQRGGAQNNGDDDGGEEDLRVVRVAGCGLVRLTPESLVKAGAPRRYKPREWDWSMSDASLAERHGLSSAKVNRLRKEHGRKSDVNQLKDIDWATALSSAVSRGLTSGELARELACSITSVSANAKELGVSLCRKRHGKAMVVGDGIASVLHDAAARGLSRKELADERGVTVAAVKQWIRKSGIRLRRTARGGAKPTEWSVECCRIADRHETPTGAAIRLSRTPSGVLRAMSARGYRYLRNGHWERVDSERRAS